MDHWRAQQFQIGRRSILLGVILLEATFLHHLEMETVIGRYGVDPTGVQVKHFALTVQWQQGRKEIFWPEELATATPILR